MNYDDTHPDSNSLHIISSDFIIISDILKKSSKRIRKAGFSCPIFLMCEEPSSIGTMLIEKRDADTQWNYYASFLNEFIEAGLINREKQEFFEKSYKKPDEFCCLFVADPDFMKFLYIPYPAD